MVSPEAVAMRPFSDVVHIDFGVRHARLVENLLTRVTGGDHRAGHELDEMRWSTIRGD